MLTRFLKKLFKFLLIPQRCIFCYFGFLAIINIYAMRLCLDFTFDHIINDKIYKIETHKTNNRTRQGTLIKAKTTTATMLAPKTKARTTNSTVRLNTMKPNAASTALWSDTMQAVVLTAFYVGYIFTIIPGARLAERYGGKWILGIGILVSGIITLLTPLAFTYGGPLALFGTRLCVGLFEGPTLPSISAMLTDWVPTNERGKLGTFVLSADQIGIIFVSIIVSFMVLQQLEWAYIYYFFGSCALLWFLGYAIVCTGKPEWNPYIEEREKLYIKKETYSKQRRSTSSIGTTASKATIATNDTMPWRNMLTNTPFWAFVSATMQYDWNEFMFIGELQQLIYELKNKTISECLNAALVLMAPYVLNWLASLFMGALSDLLIERKILSLTSTRKLMTLASLISISAFISISAYLVYANNDDATQLLQCIWAIFGAGAYYAGIKLLPLDMSPNYAGTVTGIANSLGTLPALLASFLKRKQLNNNTFLISLRATLWLLCTALISGEVQDYDAEAIKQKLH